MTKIRQLSVAVIKGDINRALKKWKRKYEEFGIKEELISRKEFKKPSVEKREMMNQVIRNNKRNEEIRKENE